MYLWAETCLPAGVRAPRSVKQECVYSGMLPQREAVAQGRPGTYEMEAEGRVRRRVTPVRYRMQITLPLVLADFRDG